MIAAPDNAELTDSVLLESAFAYAPAADAYTARPLRAGGSYVAEFLLGRSMEFAIKAYLIHHGATESLLRRLGHSLKQLIAEADRHGIGTTGALSMRDAEVIRNLSDEYARKGYEYPDMRIYAHDGATLIRRAAHNLLRSAGIDIWGRERYEQNAANERHRYSGINIASDANYD
jgi:hypothetical protein